MWFDGSGFKHNGPSPYEQRKLAELRASMTVEEKYEETVEDACRWLNIVLYSDPNNTGYIRVHPAVCRYKKASLATKKEIIDDFRASMTIEEKYKEKVEEACRWLNNLLCLDHNTGNIIVSNPDYRYKKEIIDEFRKMM